MSHYKDHAEGIFRFYGLFAFLGMIVLGICMVIGFGYDKIYIVFIGFGIILADFATLAITYSIHIIRKLKKALNENNKVMRTEEQETELLENINNAKTSEDSKIAQAVYRADGDTIRGIFTSALGFTKENKAAFKGSSGKDKAKIIFVITALAITLIAFMVGIVLTGFGTIGFIIMGIGGGGFFLIILSFLLISVTERQEYFKSEKQLSAKKRRRKPKNKKQVQEGELRLFAGTVTRCEVHSQHIAGGKTPKISGTLYQVWIVPKNGGSKFRLISSKFFKKGQTVNYYENKGQPKSRRLQDSQSKKSKRK